MTPSDARKLENQNKLQQRYKSIYENYHPHSNRTKSPNSSILNVGDNVRISAYKGIFDKKYKKNWTMEIFTIDKVFNTKPITYLLKDNNNEEIKGCFYRKELQIVH